MEICPAYISKYKPNCEKQITFLMIPNEKGCHHLVVKKLSSLLRGITSKNNGDIYCVNYLHFLEQKTSLDFMKKYVKIKIFVELFCKLRKIMQQM